MTLPALGPASARWRALHPRIFFGETWRRADAEAAGERAQATTYDVRPWIALAVGAVCLTAMEYFGSTYQLADVLDGVVGGYEAWALRNSPFFGLYELAYWSAWRVVGYLVVPALVVRVLFRQTLREYGFKWRGVGQLAWIYALCVAVMLPLVAFVSFRPDFATYYPFYRHAGRSWGELALWESMYAIQFLSLEFFFRGFWLFACRRAMGSYAIAVTLVPYCMIHFGKPWPEALAAVVAGTVLGTLALRTRSIWGGVLIHTSVALSMDLAAVLQEPGLPRTLWPTP